MSASFRLDSPPGLRNFQSEVRNGNIIQGTPLTEEHNESRLRDSIDHRETTRYSLPATIRSPQGLARLPLQANIAFLTTAKRDYAMSSVNEREWSVERIMIAQSSSKTEQLAAGIS